MWLVILLVVLAVVTGVFGAIVEGLLWLFVIAAILLLAAGLVGRATRGGGPSTTRR